MFRVRVDLKPNGSKLLLLTDQKYASFQNSIRISLAGNEQFIHNGMSITSMLLCSFYPDKSGGCTVEIYDDAGDYQDTLNAVVLDFDRPEKIKYSRSALNNRYRMFVANPSATNFTMLSSAMLAYQDIIKNQEI